MFGEQQQRTRHVGEQYRDLLALAFESIFGSEDFSAEERWSVRFERAEPFCGQPRNLGSLEQSLSALITKICAEPICFTAILADNFEARAAVLAEYGIGLILGLAKRTVHIDYPKLWNCS
jgi:hypothetical protein